MDTCFNISSSGVGSDYLFFYNPDLVFVGEVTTNIRLLYKVTGSVNIECVGVFCRPCVFIA